MDSPHNPIPTAKRSAHRAAFSLVEVTLAIGVTAFCLLAIFGLLPIGLNASHSAVEQTGASGIISLVASDLRETSPPAAGNSAPVASPQFTIPIPQNPITSSPTPTTLFFTGDGKLTRTESDARYRVTVTFPPNGTSSSRAATYATLQVSWPAIVPVTKAFGRVQTFVALDRN